MRGVLKSTTSALLSDFSVTGAMVVLAVVSIGSAGGIVVLDVVVTSGSVGGMVVLDVVTTGSVTKGVVSGFSVKCSGSWIVMVVVLVWWCGSVSRIVVVVVAFSGASVKCSVSRMALVVVVVGVSGASATVLVVVGCRWCSGFSCLWCFPGCLLAI